MKNMALLLATFVIASYACHSPQTTTNTSDMKANLLDGSWEANFIAPQGKPFAELFPKNKPVITFNTKENRASGNTGCNDFTGGFSTDGNKLKFDANMAVTKKMCITGMDGEKVFLETLKKVTSYATSDGKTLNLIMGDIAVMRLARKE